MGELLDEDWEKLREGLLLLGWFEDGRATSEDAYLLLHVAREALERRDSGTLTDEATDELAVRAYERLAPYVMDPGERGALLGCAYRESKYLRDLVPLVDEATLCVYRGYWTAGLAILFVVVESALRGVLGWRPGQPDPKFAQLRDSVLRLGPAWSHVHKVLMVIYARYDPESPPAFLFNRHGLLHGVRGRQPRMDEMNCARMLYLLDAMCFAEGLSRGCISDPETQLRWNVYQGCVNSGRERALLDRALGAEGAPP